MYVWCEKPGPRPNYIRLEVWSRGRDITVRLALLCVAINRLLECP